MLLPGQTVIFLGDHSSPDEPGYVRIVRDVLARFRPGLNLNLIPAGAQGQTAGGLSSPDLRTILTTSKPDWISVAVGLADALREPALPSLLAAYNDRLEHDSGPSAADPTIGPEHSRRNGESRMENTELLPSHSAFCILDSAFRAGLSSALAPLQQAGIRIALHTPIAVGSDPRHPLNLALRAYSAAIRDLASSAGFTLVDDQRAFAAILDRATSYKQRVALADLSGHVNPQGHSLLARTFLSSFNLLPSAFERR